MKISIILPFNGDRGFLNSAIKSVDAQNFDSFELVPNLSKYSQGYNINRAIEKSKGDYIKILHDDDLLLPNCLKILYDAIGDNDWICANAYQGFKDFEYKYTTRSIPPINLKQLLQLNTIHGGTTLYKRECFTETGGYDEALETAEEYDFHLKLLSKGYKLGYINKPVYFYRLHNFQKHIIIKREKRAKIKERIKAKYEKI